MKQESSDNELIKKVISGQSHAYDELMIRYQTRVTGIIARHIDDSSQIKDLSQEVFIKVFENLDKFKSNSSFFTWLYRITQNTIKNHYKVKSGEAKYIEVDTSKIDSYRISELMNHASSPEYIVMGAEAVLMITGAYDQLSSELKECIYLHDLVGLSYHQISRHLGCPIGTVRSRIHRARAYVHNSLDDDLT